MTTPAKTMDTEEPQEEAMSLLDHLRELRDRLFRAVLALVVGTVVGFLLAEPALRAVAERVPGQKFFVINPTEGLTNYFMISVTIGRFGDADDPLSDHRLIMPGLFCASGAGCSLPADGVVALHPKASWFLFLPNAIDFCRICFPVFQAQYRIDETLPFFTNVIFWMGVAFEMPIFIFLLAKLNVITARVLIRHWRYAILVIAISASLITPTPDPVNMLIVMLPLLVLYVISIGLAAIARRGATTPAMLDPDGK
jgi:sec-independent protein translocase protein TatC